MAYFVRKRFDSSNINWTDDYEYNRLTIVCNLRHCETILRNRGYLFLNDIYKALGYPLTREGQITGWTYEDGQTEFKWSIYKIKGKNDIGIKLYSQKNILDVLPEE